MKNLQAIKNDYPKAIKAKPKGWKFICGGSLIKKGDKIWNYGTGPFTFVEDHLHGQRAEVYNPIIREIKVTPKPPKVPDMLTIPSGHVYIGSGKECHPSWKVGVPEYFDFCFLDGSKFWNEMNGWDCSNYPIIAKINSPLHKAQPWYKP